jgi:hypothetical protein
MSITDEGALLGAIEILAANDKMPEKMARPNGQLTGQSKIGVIAHESSNLARSE